MTREMFDDNAIKLLEARYLNKDETGKITEIIEKNDEFDEYQRKIEEYYGI